VRRRVGLVDIVGVVHRDLTKDDLRSADGGGKLGSRSWR